MTKKEAIEILQLPLDRRPPIESPLFDDALQLGIEAMKMLKRMQEFGTLSENSLLPGETK